MLSEPYNFTEDDVEKNRNELEDNEHEYEEGGLCLLNVNYVIIEIQKKPIQKIDNLDNLIKKVKDKGQPLYLTIINNNNQRRYLGVKLK